jgi:tRNA(Ile)-lysidine synthase
MKLIKTILTFLHDRWDGTSPLLLGYSGGPDSKALLYALLEAGVRSLHLAHVDHGWRAESGKEAALIQQEARELGLICHVHRLTEKKEGNLEEQARLARLRFFQKLFEEIPFQALLLAHHAGDLAETVLKRLFEGAHLCSLGGMSEEAQLEDMRVWRPLLRTPKADLMQFLERQSLAPFIDSTNEDRRFQRARLRRDVVPTLEIFFGKKMASNLEALSIRSHELKAYLDKQIEPLWAARVEGPWGGRIDLSGVDRIVQRHLLRQKILQDVSREALENALDAGENGLFFWASEKTPEFLEPIALREGTFSSGDWQIEVTPFAHGPRNALTWEEVWTGTFEAVLPEGVLQMPSSTFSLRDAWRVLKVPLSLRGKWPVVQQNEKIWDLLHRSNDVRWKVRFSVAKSMF